MGDVLGVAEHLNRKTLYRDQDHPWLFLSFPATYIHKSFVAHPGPKTIGPHNSVVFVLLRTVCKYAWELKFRLGTLNVQYSPSLSCMPPKTFLHLEHPPGQ